MSNEMSTTYTKEELWKILAETWASGYWHGTSHEGPLNEAAVEAKNPYRECK